jgi:myo-inositol-1(or 4)-monophosphatase
MTYLDFLDKTLNKAAKIAIDKFGRVTPITKPGDNNQVLTDADIAIGNYIINEIEREFPEHNIIDEEAGAIQKHSAFTWVIDPIEGTSNFANGSEDYGIMVGLLFDAKPIAGGIIVPERDALYLAEKGKGATKNDQSIRVTAGTNLLSKLVSYGIDAYQNDPKRTHQESKLVAEIVLSIRNLRNAGCEAIDSMRVAEGIYGGRVNLTSKIWDNVAPQIIVEEAGGLWTDITGKPIDYTEPLTRIDQNFTNCIGSPELHRHLIDIILKWKDTK